MTVYKRHNNSFNLYDPQNTSVDTVDLRTRMPFVEIPASVNKWHVEEYSDYIARKYFADSTHYEFRYGHIWKIGPYLREQMSVSKLVNGYNLVPYTVDQYGMFLSRRKDAALLHTDGQLVIAKTTISRIDVYCDLVFHSKADVRSFLTYFKLIKLFPKIKRIIKRSGVVLKYKKLGISLRIYDKTREMRAHNSPFIPHAHIVRVEAQCRGKNEMNRFYGQTPCPLTDQLALLGDKERINQGFQRILQNFHLFGEMFQKSEYNRKVKAALRNADFDSGLKSFENFCKVICIEKKGVGYRRYIRMLEENNICPYYYDGPRPGSFCPKLIQRFFELLSDGAFSPSPAIDITQSPENHNHIIEKSADKEPEHKPHTTKHRHTAISIIYHTAIIRCTYWLSGRRKPRAMHNYCRPPPL